MFLPKGASCSSSTYQLSTKGVTVANFLPLASNGTAVCSNNANGSVNLYYGGWASPYTDNYTSDPLFTTMGAQGMIERRSAGSSEKLQLTYTSQNKRITFLAAYGWLSITETRSFRTRTRGSGTSTVRTGSASGAARDSTRVSRCATVSSTGISAIRSAARPARRVRRTTHTARSTLAVCRCSSTTACSWNTTSSLLLV